MKGYVIFLQAGEYGRSEQVLLSRGSADRKIVDAGEEKASKRKRQEWIFVEPEETKAQYAIPSAFVKYAEYLNLVIGKDALQV